MYLPYLHYFIHSLLCMLYLTILATWWNNLWTHCRYFQFVKLLAHSQCLRWYHKKVPLIVNCYFLPNLPSKVCSHRKKKVPDLLLATIEPIEGLPAVGRSCLIHVFVTRPKQHARGEMNACIVSDSLPFIEYDIYKQLVNKLKVNGMNALFGLKVGWPGLQICVVFLLHKKYILKSLRYSVCYEGKDSF